MSQKSKSSVAEDLTDLVALLPWWAGIALAGTCYLVLHRLAAPAPISGVRTEQVGTAAAHTVVAAAAMVGQYFLPLFCCVGAGLSAFRRFQRKSLVENTVQSQSASVLDSMSWQQFEILVGEAFRLQGFTVVETGGGGPDGGIDLVLAKGGERFLVQCKQWKAFKVGVDVVRELYGVMAAKGAAGGFVVTSGTFTADANEFAQGRNVNLVDGQMLFGLVGQAQTSVATQAAPGPNKYANSLPTTSSPSCPSCGSVMVKRTAKKGPNAGLDFWGCSKYPNCKGTRSISG